MLALSANKSFNQEMCSGIEGCTYNPTNINNHFGDSSIDLSCLGGDFYSAMSEGAVIQVNEIETADGNYRYLNQKIEQELVIVTHLEMSLLAIHFPLKIST